MIERIHLSILLEIERKGSLTAAAKSLHLTQSALSHAIKKLEQQCGTPIWHKKGRGLRFSEAGNYLLATARRLLPQLELADEVMEQFASGEKGTLRIGMECHPCYQWLLKVVEPYLKQWPAIDMDVKQQFQFGGMAALFSYEIDILVTPDPLFKKGIEFVPVFDYELVMAVNRGHNLVKKNYIEGRDLSDQTLYSYPVDTERLDIYTQFLLPAKCSPKKHKTIEATDIMLQMVAASRGVAALPKWLVDEYQNKLPIESIRLGKKGIFKKIYLGMREGDQVNHHIKAFLELGINVPN